MWLKKPEIDPRFKAVLRIDPLLLGWPKVSETLPRWDTTHLAALDGADDGGGSTFPGDWLDRMQAFTWRSR